MRKIPILDLKPQYDRLKPEIDQAISRVIASTQFIMGSEVESFEKEIATFLGAKHAVAMNSGTDALVIGLRAVGVKSGDEVITTSFSFFATAEAVSIIGANPVFVDIEKDGFNIDVSAIKKAITPKTKAIIPVHLYGETCDVEQITKMAPHIPVLEDCAQSLGSTWKGKKSGTWGKAGALSFFPSKNLGAMGDGGMLVTNDDSVALEAKKLRAHGSIKKYYNEIIGYNSRLDAIQAAILRVKLKSLEAWNTERLQIAKQYNELLSGVKGVTLPKIVPGHVFHQYTIRIEGKNRDAVQKELESRGISTMIYYPIPIHQLPPYRAASASLPETEKRTLECLSLPIGVGLSRDDIEYVSKNLREVMEK